MLLYTTFSPADLCMLSLTVTNLIKTMFTHYALHPRSKPLGCCSRLQFFEIQIMKLILSGWLTRLMLGETNQKEQKWVKASNEFSTALFLFM